MLKRFSAPILAAVASVTILIAGCATTPHPADSTANPAATDTSKPILAAAMAPTTSPAFPASQPAEVVAELSTTKITKADLDKLLYQTYGLQMVFDLIELDLAKNTLLVQQNKTLQQADIDRERDIVFSQMFKKADKADYDSYFAQFLQKEKIKREEFDIRAIQTSACLRKIIEPLVIGKFSQASLRRGYEIMYGANRQIADITLGNVRDAAAARERIKTEPFEKVAREMSIDTATRDTGGLWAPFSAQSSQVSQVIIESAFSLDVGHVSDILQDGSSFHLIKVIGVIDPKAARFEDVKADVQKQMEDKLIEKNMKELRQQLQAMAQQQIKFDDPILKAQWDQIIASQQPKSTDKNAVLQEMNQKK